MSSVFYDFVLLLFHCVHLVFVLVVVVVVSSRLFIFLCFVESKKSYVNSGILYIIDLS